MQKNIQLGLDLRGGSHLVLQVQVQDAMKAEADQTMERLKEELRKAGIDYAAMDRNDPATIEEADTIQINVHGVPAAKTGGLPAHRRRRRFQRLGADAGQLDRLPAEPEADRAGRC